MVIASAPAGIAALLVVPGRRESIADAVLLVSLVVNEDLFSILQRD